jgi:uncharacterized protein HemY|tara:strand:- start:39 stop:389 length:351 start_codon:yes stop_codon:yes gene_type:complete
MNKDYLFEIDKLVKLNKIKEAEFKISKLGHEYYKDTDYLYLRSKIFFSNKLYYMALDALLIATEFKEEDRIYQFIAKIYDTLGNHELSKKISNSNLRLNVINSLKKELTGITQEEE